MRALRWLLLIEALAFGNASLIHFGVLVAGFEHRKAGMAEAIIGAVLLVGWAAVMLRPKAFRGIAIGVQGFALLGTLIGGFTIAIGVGPKTTADMIFHAIILIVLISGFVGLLRTGPA